MLLAMKKVHKTPWKEEKVGSRLVLLDYNETYGSLMHSKKYLPSILIVQSMAVKKVQLVLFQRSIRMPGSKLMRS
jgi:hypothetical protein